jgi:hypothetical protein
MAFLPKDKMSQILFAKLCAYILHLLWLGFGYYVYFLQNNLAIWALFLVYTVILIASNIFIAKLRCPACGRKFHGGYFSFKCKHCAVSALPKKV